MLTDKETETLTALLKKVEWPLAPSVFHALMEKTVSVPVELAVFDQKGRILLIHRDDHEFTGWHLPGTVLRDTDDVGIALKRLITHELAGVAVTAPVNLGWFEAKRDLTPTRHGVSLLHGCQLESVYTGPGTFFERYNLPTDVLAHHKLMAPLMYWRARADNHFGLT
ncbi:MAG: hypothetical protein JWN49_736 [Parcubacteria group bacterium]|nr:hypothetical protein [Parcubacteria group bacterium]